MGTEITPSYYADIMPHEVFMAHREWERCRLHERLVAAGATGDDVTNLGLERVKRWMKPALANRLRSPLETWLETGMTPECAKVRPPEQEQREQSTELKHRIEDVLRDPDKLEHAMRRARDTMARLDAAKVRRKMETKRLAAKRIIKRRSVNRGGR